MQRSGRFFPLPGKDQAWQEPERDGSGQADQTFFMLQDLPQRASGTSPVLRRCPVIRDEPAQGTVPFNGFGQQHDEPIRRDTTLDKLERRRPAFVEDGRARAAPLSLDADGNFQLHEAQTRQIGLGVGIFATLAAIAMLVQYMRHNEREPAPRPIARARR
jgi:hypothetical protein